MHYTTITFDLERAPWIAQDAAVKLQITGGTSNSLSIFFSKGKPCSPDYETKSFSIVKPSRSMINALDGGHVIHCTYGQQNSLEVQALNISMQKNKETPNLSTIKFETGCWEIDVSAEDAFGVLTAITGF